VTDMLSDGFGNQWEKCAEDCLLEIVRPGKVQCVCDEEEWPEDYYDGEVK
jgi:hypothetical protein